jgi:hypothetical protein
MRRFVWMSAVVVVLKVCVGGCGPAEKLDPELKIKGMSPAEYREKEELDREAVAKSKKGAARRAGK